MAETKEKNKKASKKQAPVQTKPQPRLKTTDNKAQAKASVKTQRISARKARLVADLFRGKDVNVALGILNNTNKKASELFIKVLNSAIANATNNHGMDASKLFVKEVLVNEGPTLKRFQPHSQGRATEILKRTSHISITLEERN